MIPAVITDSSALLLPVSAFYLAYQDGTNPHKLMSINSFKLSIKTKHQIR